jgi:uncharacterized membrane protein YciS (DUF1049 family)
MKMDPTESDRASQALITLRGKRDFRLHLLIYTLVNVMLVATWAVTGGFFWPIFPMVGWGLGVAINGWSVYWRNEISEAEVRREVERLQAKGHR